MPNGGSDNCSNCWHNERNDKAGSIVRDRYYGPIRCLLRDLEIAGPHWTYCANNPAPNPNRVDIPVGAVMKNDRETQRRVPLHPSPDTPAIREGLLKILNGVSSDRMALGVEFTAIKQLGQWKEAGAVEGLRRILGFGDDRALEIAYALIALNEILGAEAKPDLDLHLGRARETLGRMDRHIEQDMVDGARKLLEDRA